MGFLDDVPEEQLIRDSSRNLWGIKGDYRVRFMHGDHWHTAPFHCPTLEFAANLAKAVQVKVEAPTWACHKDDPMTDEAIQQHIAEARAKLDKSGKDETVYAMIYHKETGKALNVNLDNEPECPNCHSFCEPYVEEIARRKHPEFFQDVDEQENKIGAEALMDMLKMGGPSRQN